MPDQLSPAEYRKIARARVTDLAARLDAEGGRARFAEALDLVAHLGHAIDSFHMEAIRFRMFTLERRFGNGEIPASDAARAILNEVKHALEAAGFHTRSITQ